MKAGVAPSMMCVPIQQTAEFVKQFEALQVEYLHVDVMDGSFVPNFAQGSDYIYQLRKLTRIPLDIHLMIEHPEDKVDWFDLQPGELVSIHVESTHHLQRALEKVRTTGAIPQVALNPATPVNTLDYVLDDVQGVLVMTVNPGFAGQKAVPSALRKIGDVRRYLAQKNRSEVTIEVDGNVSFELAQEMARNGAELFVLGTSSVLSPTVDLEEGIARFRALIAPKAQFYEGKRVTRLKNRVE